MHFSLSSRNYRFLRAPPENMGHTCERISLAWKFVSGVFVGADRVAAICECMKESERSRFQRLSVDALSNTHLTLWVTGRGNASSLSYVSVYICIYMCVCRRARAFWIARLLAGLQRTLLYVLLLRHGDSIIIYFVCRTRVLSWTLWDSSACFQFRFRM